MVVRGPGQEEKIRQTPRAEGGEGARSAAPEARPSLTGGREVCRWMALGYGLSPRTAPLLGGGGGGFSYLNLTLIIKGRLMEMLLRYLKASFSSLISIPKWLYGGYPLI